jgi:hypothetical protein
MIRKQSGALLLMVALLLATIAALSFGLNHAAGMDALAVQHQYDMRAAGYLAEAGVAAARWRNQVKGCTGVSMEPTTFGTGTFEAMVTKAGSKRLNVTATGTVGDGTLRKITRNNIDIADFNAKTTTRDLAGAALDTTIVYGSVWPDSARTDLSLASGVAHALLYWPAGEITSDLRVLSATLILTQNGTGAATRTVGVHRVTTQWDTYATWYAARPFTGRGRLQRWRLRRQRRCHHGRYRCRHLFVGRDEPGRRLGHQAPGQLRHAAAPGQSRAIRHVLQP